VPPKFHTSSPIGASTALQVALGDPAPLRERIDFPLIGE